MAALFTSMSTGPSSLDRLLDEALAVLRLGEVGGDGDGRPAGVGDRADRAWRSTAGQQVVALARPCGPTRPRRPRRRRSARAMASPMPRLAPVTRTTRPSSDTRSLIVRLDPGRGVAREHLGAVLVGGADREVDGRAVVSPTASTVAVVVRSSPGHTCEVKRPPNSVSRPSPTRSVSMRPVMPMVSMPWANTLG